MSTPSENGPALPLRPALRIDDDGALSPRSGPSKVVSIAEPEEIPLSPTTDDSLPRPKQFPAGVSSRRMTGRPNLPSGSSSRASLVSLASLDDYNASTDTSAQGNKSEEKLSHGHAHRHKQEHHVHQHDKLLLQVSEWLQREKAKRAAKKSKRGSKGRDLHVDREESESGSSSRPRTSSQGSDASAISLERLQRILEDNMSGFGHEALPMHPEPRRPSLAGPRRKSSVRRSRGSSDTEYQDGDVVVPSCDVVLDNSKTLSYSGGHESSDTTVTLSTSKRAEKERKAWLVFKSEIVKLAHTLRLKGWRRVPLENGGDIEVERLSGALTNAVYVVSPPLTIPTNPAGHAYKAPPKLLLRIYGPQVEHLIDRENELGILRRLARKKIGPRLLGTFTNGRFEEFFNATTLTAADLRVEGTSKQIAKRMRELHDGIDLLESEREEGPFVWQNWEKWVGRCAEVVEYLDAEILRGVEGGSGKGREPWRARGLVCGVEWKVFKAAVSGFKKWLEEYYRAKGGVARNLVFAHNDTQYGNILRLLPPAPSPGSTPSPLLLPQNTHKQLIVIDFEYASANTPGLEFANHFSEWCYNYHDPSKPWACNTDNYPSVEEQRRFLRSYVLHRPQFHARASGTPKLGAVGGEGVVRGSGSISEFLLDSRTPGGTGGVGGGGVEASGYAEDEARRERDTERRVDELLKEVRIWRVANSAQWVAWGIVQAKVPELDGPVDGAAEDGISSPLTTATDSSPAAAQGTQISTTPTQETPNPLAPLEKTQSQVIPPPEQADQQQQQDAEQEAEFDYLAYAQERALFFWGDVVSLGLVKREELPEGIRGRIKVVDF